MVENIEKKLVRGFSVILSEMINILVCLILEIKKLKKLKRQTLRRRVRPDR